ncbi:MAG: prephenate dehydrogenase [Bacillota bacterium]|nr:prephenate dehydrogenase [Bacillota bacterium]
MKIAIVGLGLIGGSIAKAIKKTGDHMVYGHDLNTAVLKAALADGAIDSVLDPKDLKTCRLILVAIYPQAAVEYIKSHCKDINPEATVIDCCGVKRYICQEIWPIGAQHGFTFIGGHPMAGLEVAGYENSNAELYNKASMILTPHPDTDEAKIQAAGEFFLSLGFGHIEITTPENHDKNIAYTSQLAHVVSNAYVKSPGAAVHKGFSAGSYKDLTRVAKLEENMWTELFLENDDFLLGEINTLMDNLQEYARALKKRDSEKLRQLLKAGRQRKELVD